MTIAGANILSMLAGSEVSSAYPQGVFNGSSGQAGFSSAFMEQLGLLQAGLINGQSAEFSALPSTEAENAQTTMQNFAALFGNSLPTAGKIDQQIDLDDTLQSLADVLQHLQALENGGQAGDEVLALSDDLKTEIAKLKQLLPEDDAAAMDNALAMASQIQAAPVATPEPVPAQAEVSDELLDGAGAEKLAAGVMSSSLKSEVVVTQDKVLPTSGDGGENQGGEFDQGFTAMLKQQDETPSGQDKNQQGLNFQDQASGGQVGKSTTDSGAETDKTLSAITNDIARMNTVVRSDNRVEVPAMTRHVNDPAWNQELGEKLVWMHKQAVPSAELRLNPEHLGPVLIKIDVHNDQASIAFTAQNQGVKDAIEAAIPKLREMLNGQQLNLADVNVSQQQSEQRQSPRDFFQAAGDQGRNPRAQADDELDEAMRESKNIADEIEAGRAIAGNGLLSLFA